MPKVSKETASQVQEFGPVTDRREKVDGYTIEFVSFGADSDLDVAVIDVDTEDLEPIAWQPDGTGGEWPTVNDGTPTTGSMLVP